MCGFPVACYQSVGFVRGKNIIPDEGHVLCVIACALLISSECIILRNALLTTRIIIHFLSS